MTYEKVSGYELDRGHSYLLYRDPARGISDRCAKRCQSDIRCHAFNLDYNRNECSALEFGECGFIYNFIDMKVNDRFSQKTLRYLDY